MDDEEEVDVDHPDVPTVEVSDPNDNIVGTILGPKGKPLHTVVKRRHTIGFIKGM